MAQFNFDQEAEPSSPRGDIELLPVAKYDAHIIESDVAPLKSGKGTGLSLTIEILSPGYKGRRVWASLNVAHENPKAQEIAQRDLSALKIAVGMPGKLTNTDDLHFRPFTLGVKVEPAQNGYPAKNVQNGFFPPGGATAGLPQSTSTRPAPNNAGAYVPPRAPSQPQQPPQTGSATPPWARKASA
jgi:Protein of unknown function (DUF669)